MEDQAYTKYFSAYLAVWFMWICFYLWVVSTSVKATCQIIKKISLSHNPLFSFEFSLPVMQSLLLSKKGTRSLCYTYFAQTLQKCSIYDMSQEASFSLYFFCVRWKKKLFWRYKLWLSWKQCVILAWRSHTWVAQHVSQRNTPLGVHLLSRYEGDRELHLFFIPWRERPYGRASFLLAQSSNWVVCSVFL